MTYLVTGASGLVGGSIYRHLKTTASSNKITAIGYRHTLPGMRSLNIMDEQQITNLFAEIRPNIVFHTAALGSADQCEKDHLTCRAMNFESVALLARLTQKIGGILVHYSTDYIFDGQNGPYKETDTPNPINYYGQMKQLAEEIIKKLLPNNHLIIRTTVIYGWEYQGKNFCMSLIKRLQEGQRIQVPMDQIGTPTFVEDLSTATLKLLENNCRGTYHVAGLDIVDRYRFAQEIASVFNLNQNLIEPRLTQYLGQVAPRPLKAGLVTQKLKHDASITCRGYQEGLRAMALMPNPYQLKEPLNEPTR